MKKNAPPLNVKNRTIFTDRRGLFTPAGKRRKDTVDVIDNLHFLRGMNSECVDLIYLDPPFNSKREYRAPIGGNTAAFEDAWTMDMTKAEWAHRIAVWNPPLAKVLDAAGDAGHKSDKPYLIFMAIRLLEMRRILKPTGSIYLHCDPTMSHWLKLMMDCIFGVANFRNEIIWHYRTYQGRIVNCFPKKHDTVFMYGKSNNVNFVLDYQDNYRDTVDYKRWRKFYVNENQILFGNHPTTDVRFASYLKRWKKENGRNPKKGEVIYTCRGYVVDDVWDLQAIDPKDTKEKTGYPTQKPLALLERIITASSNTGDVVLDPFCGCATACVAAEKLGRQWIGMDISPIAWEMVKARMENDLQIATREGAQHGEQSILRLSQKNKNGKTETWLAHHRIIPPMRNDAPSLNLANSKTKSTVRNLLFLIQDGHCNGCGVNFDKVHLAIDHVTPKSWGGLNLPTNLQLLCGACNNSKGTKTMEQFIADRRKIGLFVRKIPGTEYREKEKWEKNVEEGRPFSGLV